MTRELTVTIRESDAGRGVAAFLAGRFTYHDAAAWAALLDEGRVRVNGRRAEAGAALKSGDRLTYDASGIPEPPVDTRVEALLDDPLLLAVNKPGNLPCHPGGRYFNHTLWAIVKARFGVPAPVLVNRLDRETSGLVLVAKTPESARSLGLQFSGRLVAKRYAAIVEGAFPEQAEAAGWLTADAGSAVRKKRRFTPAAPGGGPPAPGAEWAETRFERERLCGGLSLVRALPRTGRLHQLRATLLALGFPVAGDKLYGVDETLFLRFCADALTEEDRRRLRLGRQALHAAALRFRHPRLDAPVELEAPLPADLAALLEPPAAPPAGAPPPLSRERPKINIT